MAKVNICDGRTQLYRWDTGVKIEMCGCTNVTECHFVIADGVVIRRDVEDNICDVPDVALTKAGMLVVYAFARTADEGVTRHEFRIAVQDRPKPADYIDPPDEYDNLDELAKRVAPLVPPAPYTLPTASAETLGGVKVGAGLQMDGEALGVVPEGEFELIESITLNEEVASILRTKEPSGKAYNFKKVYVHAETPQAPKDAFIYVTVNASIILAPMTNAINTYAAGGIGQALAEVKNGFVDGYGIGAKNASTSAQLYRYCSTRTLPNGEKSIREVMIRCTDSMPIGTTIKIWGVRA